MRGFIFKFACAALFLCGSREALLAEEPAFRETFEVPEVVEEAANASLSSSPGWWVDSGGRFLMEGGIGSTVKGALPQNDPWRTLYAQTNALDTDGGYHPQNIFRLVTRGRWGELTQEVYFRILSTNPSASSNRNASNGILFFHRYQDGDNLYYAGVRVDGAVVVKKKLAGVYTTLAYRKLYAGTYDRERSSNLIPSGTWIGMRTVTTDLEGGGVSIRLELDDPTLGSGWTPVLEVEDSGVGPSGAAIAAAGHAGIRTDFMDVELDDYQAAPICQTTAVASRRTFRADGGSATIDLSAPAGCPWTVSSGARWLTVDSEPSGAGSGTVAFTVDPNRRDRRRRATITVGGTAITVTQRARRGT